MAQMKEQIKTPERELNDEEIANLSDAKFKTVVIRKTLVIRRLNQEVEYRCKIEKKVKAMQSEIKKNIQGTNK